MTGRVGRLAYRVRLPESMSGIHPVFHVSMLRRCLQEGMIPAVPDDLEVLEDATFKVVPERIIDTRVKKLRHKELRLVKVQWTSDENDCTWEPEEKCSRSIRTYLVRFKFSLYMHRSIFLLHSSLGDETHFRSIYLLLLGFQKP